MIEILAVSFVIVTGAVGVYFYSKKESKPAEYLWVGVGENPFKKN